MRATRRLFASVILALGFGLAVIPQPAEAARRAGPLVGVGEQKPEMFASKPWKRLGLRDARYTAPWDALQDPNQLALLDTWMVAARRARVRVLLGFAHSLRTQKLARTLPTQRQFERQFKRFRKRYPWVRDWLTWNEANHPGALTENRPRRAAQYFDAVARNCRGCRVVAADVIDTRNMAGWVTRFRRHARHTPKIWGLHNYGDANGLKVRGTAGLLAITRGKIWFTETGGVVLRRDYRGRKVLRTYRYSLRHAAGSTKHVLQLSCLSPRITRIYLYHWQPPPKVTNWDSALVDRRGRPRPAFAVVQRWLQRAARASRRGGRRALCRGAGVSRKRTALARPSRLSDIGSGSPATARIAGRRLGEAQIVQVAEPVSSSSLRPKWGSCSAPSLAGSGAETGRDSRAARGEALDLVALAGVPIRAVGWKTRRTSGVSPLWTSTM